MEPHSFRRSEALLLWWGLRCSSRLRRKQPGKALFLVPAGPLFSTLGVIICAGLLTQVDFNQTMILAVTMLLALANWGWARTNG